MFSITGCKNIESSNISSNTSRISTNIEITSSHNISEYVSESASNIESTTSTTSIDSSSITITESSVEINSADSSSQSTNDLFISEFFNLKYKYGVYEVQNSNNDKALELFNPLNVAIDLSNYKIIIYSSGSTEIKPDYTISLSGTIEAKTTYTIVNSFAREELKQKADLLAKVYIGGKSAVGLYKNDVLIDTFGEIGKSYNSVDDFVINGTIGAADVHNVIRNAGYTANKQFTENEWEVRFDTDLSSLGKHIFDYSSIVNN